MHWMFQRRRSQVLSNLRNQDVLRVSLWKGFKRCRAAEVEYREYFRTCRKLRVASERVEFDFAAVFGPLVCDLASELVGLSRRADAKRRDTGGSRSSAVHSADCRPVTAVSIADRVVSGFARVADPGCVHISRAGGRGRSMGASASRVERRRAGPGCGPTALGPKRESADRVSIRAGKHGQES